MVIIMDRRQRKTRDAIFKAFSSLLETKRYEHISVQDIIDRADIGRSTFYAHFETKDALLKTMCSDIFNHIFEGNMCEYNDETGDLEAKLAHILWHLREHKNDIMGLLSGESSELFMGYISEYLKILFSLYIEDFNASVPEDYLIGHLVGSFSQTIKWWVKNGMKIPPEETAKYFIEVTETH